MYWFLMYWSVNVLIFDALVKTSQLELGKLWDELLPFLHKTTPTNPIVIGLLHIGEVNLSLATTFGATFAYKSHQLMQLTKF